MKKVMMIMVLGALMACLVPANAQEWRSTSTMRGAGSSYTPQVTAVGAASAASTATTTSSYSPAKSGPRRGYDANGEWTPDAEDLEYAGDHGQSGESPIGDAVLPLMAFSLMACGVIYFRRKRRV